MDDTISRKAALDAISCDITVTGRQNAELVAATIGAFADRIKALPSAQKKGKWIDMGDDYVLRWKCSECENRYHHIFNYCPECGAYMRTEDGEWA